MIDPLRWTAVLIRSLYLNGVRHAVISPGSRSTPITLAVAIHPGITKKVVLDERSAGFIALGIAKSSGIPALLICTSGTALANYFPAVIEARKSGVPMIILSADRPPYLRGIGSSQTIDQLKIFGDYTSFFHDAGEPKGSEYDFKRIAYLGKQAVEKSVADNSPVHINLPFRKPLEPDQKILREETEESIRQFEEPDHVIITNPFQRVVQPGEKITLMLEESKKPLIICGSTGISGSIGHFAQTVSDHLKAPLIAEPAAGTGISERDVIQRYEQILQKSVHLNSLKPDLIIRFGNQPYSKSILSALRAWSDLKAIHFNTNDSTQDHEMNIIEKVVLNPVDHLDLSEVKNKKESGWIEQWKQADSTAELQLENELRVVSNLTDGHIIRFLSKKLDKRWNVMISNSFTVRDVALFGSVSGNQFVNRGAAGIDGILSTAIGIATSAGKPTCCIMGDLAFYHDSNALLSLSATMNVPLVTVVINNGGGTIFRMLPVYRSESLNIPDQLFETYFETPQTTSVRKLAEAASIQYIRIEKISDMIQLDFSHLSEHTIIECITDADKAMILREKLWAG